MKFHKSRQELTLEVVKMMANTLTPYLKFTGEVSLNGEGIPVLDTKVWLGRREGGKPWYKRGRVHGKEGGNCIQYEFYSKPMANPLRILRRSALRE